ncbi:MAG: ATP-binding protein [Blautia sp.]|nr:ATP-binding protein [Blautia sp.]
MSRAAYDFCIKRGENAKTARMVSLFVEEMGVNAVKYGFESVKHGLIELKLVLKEDKRLIRLKDNGRPFDPVRWLKDNDPEDPTKNLGIRMTVGLAKNVQYIPAMKFNNMMIFL